MKNLYDTYSDLDMGDEKSVEQTDQNNSGSHRPKESCVRSTGDSVSPSPTQLLREAFEQWACITKGWNVERWEDGRYKFHHDAWLSYQAASTRVAALESQIDFLDEELKTTNARLAALQGQLEGKQIIIKQLEAEKAEALGVIEGLVVASKRCVPHMHKASGTKYATKEKLDYHRLKENITAAERFINANNFNQPKEK